MRVIGIDPGLRNLGWGVICVQGSRITHVANGQCTGDGEDMAERLLSLHTQLTEAIRLHSPQAAAVEQVFVNTNGAGTLKLGQARGIAMLVPAQAGLEVGEYAPNTIKKTVVGVGHAAKEQVQHMVRLQLPGVDLTGPDAADALAIALCHAHHLGSQMLRAAKTPGAGDDAAHRQTDTKANPASKPKTKSATKAKAAHPYTESRRSAAWPTHKRVQA